jgi:hypothetical protein
VGLLHGYKCAVRGKLSDVRKRSGCGSAASPTRLLPFQSVRAECTRRPICACGTRPQRRSGFVVGTSKPAQRCGVTVYEPPSERENHDLAGLQAGFLGLSGCPKIDHYRDRGELVSAHLLCRDLGGCDRRALAAAGRYKRRVLIGPIAEAIGIRPSSQSLTT